MSFSMNANGKCKGMCCPKNCTKNRYEYKYLKLRAMDQYPFEFKITIIGMEVDDFINMLIDKGFSTQATECENQYEKQIKEACGGESSDESAALPLHGVSNSEADCKYKDSCGLFPCNLTECDEYEPGKSEAAVCRCESSSWDRDAGCFVCDECGERI